MFSLGKKILRGAMRIVIKYQKGFLFGRKAKQFLAEH